MCDIKLDLNISTRGLKEDKKDEDERCVIVRQKNRQGINNNNIYIKKKQSGLSGSELLPISQRLEDWISERAATFLHSLFVVGRQTAIAIWEIRGHAVCRS